MADDENSTLTTTTTTKKYLYSEHFVDSVIQALLIDAPVYGILGVNPLLGFAGATVGYSLRKYCGEYMGQDSHYKPFVCGTLGGTFKYGIIKHTVAFKELALGAYNNVAYEYFGPEINGFSNSSQLASYVGIEGGEGVLGYSSDIIFNYEQAKATAIAGDAKAGLLVFMAIEGLYDNFAANLKSTLMPYAETAENAVIDSYAYMVKPVSSSTENKVEL